ncbi:site-specific integrase [Romboutsia hominis]|uniref:site-specific integrase n=1 Tax=Romboutsia hominis TaxID=1507512 RepID=UPI001F06E198|nr:site-specific integrase [Romboutsia hominis]MCH1959695.1 site-specific integrase [Romboutsia hominis]MCH1969882.1 site-specific integrase [Romboutsia hominis]
MTGGVRKRGKKWYYYFDAGIIDGKRKKVERVGGTTKKEAENALRNAIAEFNSCGQILTESDINFSDYLDYWYNEYVLVNCKFNTQVSYKSAIENHIKPELGIYKLKSLTPAKLQEFFNKKHMDGMAKQSLTKYKGILSLSLKMAVYPYQLIKESPLTYIKLPKSNKIKKDKKILSLDELEIILSKFPFGHRFHIPLQIAFHTGLRASEVCGLTWNNIDLENKTLTVEKILLTKNSSNFEFTSPKTTNSSRTIHIGDTLCNLLKKNKEWQEENELKYGKFYNHSNKNYVCLDENGNFINTNKFKYLSYVVNKNLNIPFNFHMLRHTHATLLFENGANPKDIQERLGHSRIDVTLNTYSHVTKKLKNETVDIFENAIN